MQHKMISVIIPVYNVERYLDRCVESVLRQNYLEIELLLIDDGSTDSSGEKCDTWAAKDHRVRVIHKKNGGPAEARNIGLDAALGEYIVFIDSDDFISADMIIKLYAALKGAHADMSICNFMLVAEDGSPLVELNRELPVKDEILSGLEVISRFPDYRGARFQSPVTKLYKKVLFSDIRFPVGKLCEDTFIAHRVLGKCDIVACISDAEYYYVQRPESIMHNKSVQFYMHEAEAYFDQAVYAYHRGVFRCAGHGYWKAAMSLISAIPSKDDDSKLEKERKQLLHRFRQSITLLKYCGFKERIQVLFVIVSPFLYRVIVRNFRRQSKI